MVCSSAPWYFPSSSPQRRSPSLSRKIALEPAVFKQTAPRFVPRHTSHTQALPFDVLSDWIVAVPDPIPTVRMHCKQVQGRDILTELADVQRQSSSNASHGVVHLKSAKDSHYPFALTRKSRTKPVSAICVWCIARALLARPGCPVLHVRASGHDADWERWLRDMRIAGLWEVLGGDVSPLSLMQYTDMRFSLSQFCRDLSGAILECVLRKLRGTDVQHRDLMAQVRSAKYHKVPRVAAMIEGSYTDSAS